MKKLLQRGVEIKGYASPDFERILSPEALNFIADLHRKFNHQRLELLDKRYTRQEQLEKGVLPRFLPETQPIRDDVSWRVAEAPQDLQKRHVEITGPVERKMIINAMNCGADTFMADFEDSLSPTWTSVIEGQINLLETVSGSISLKTSEGKHYRLNDKTAVLMVRPRGWHLNEKHLLIDEEPISASLFDFGLYFFHNAHALIDKGSGPYFYLPKLESHEEARLWNDVFAFSQKALNIPYGTIRATVLIETILAAFEMEEILYELKDHCAGLNAGRWDYIFSIIKKFHFKKDFVFPDRGQITMSVPFMKAYAKLLVNTCHRRGAHAIGGMAAFIPNRRNPEINAAALEQVHLDKQRESHDGFDGTWIAHPDLVGIASKSFVATLGSRPHQKTTHTQKIAVSPEELLDFRIREGSISENGLRQNVNVAMQYIESWLRGVGAVAINNLMEDAATAEISRSQLWQWIHSPKGNLESGRKIDSSLFLEISNEEHDKLLRLEGINPHKLHEAKKLLDRLAVQGHFDDFFTIPAYEQLV